MHQFAITTEFLKNTAFDSFTPLTVARLEHLAVSLLGSRDGSWVRKGEQPVVIASVKRGASASRIEEELAALSEETKKIRAIGTRDAVLRAAAFFHLRFENIHPLTEGNGRIGRAILATQLNQALGISIEEFFGQLNAHSNDYMMVFPSNEPTIQFELMLDVLARLTGHIVSEESTNLPASILPLYPDRRPLKNIPQQKRSTLPARPPQKNNYFRRFG